MEAGASNIQPADTVVLYPTYGSWDAEGLCWRVPIAGSVFQPRPEGLRQRLLLRVLRRVLQAQHSDLEGPLFQERIGGFLTVGERGRRIALTVGDRVELLPASSRANGHFRACLVLSQDKIERLQRQGAISDGWLPLRVVMPEGHGRRFDGRVQLIDPSGLSVISDIDDTMKQTDVAHRRVLLRNIFLRPFRVVPGMPEAYRSLARRGVAFHYVSSSPWQLFECLRELLDQTGFPWGSFHLRNVRFRVPGLLRLLVSHGSGKRRAITSILAAFPQRRFLLVGDSGERDPEIYGAVARRFPRQVAGILIRDVPGRELDGQRQQRAFRGLAPGLWRVFRDGHELADQLTAASDLDGGGGDQQP